MRVFELIKLIIKLVRFLKDRDGEWTGISVKDKRALTDIRDYN